MHTYRVPAPPEADAEPGNVPAVLDEPEVWASMCGELAAPDEVELVEPCTGVPCEACAVAAAVASGVAPVTRETLEAPLVELDELIEHEEPPGSVDVDSRELFALSWRELVIHRVAPDAPKLSHVGRVLVLELCGELGWGPLRSPSVPGSEYWGRCEVCEHVHATGARA